MSTDVAFQGAFVNQGCRSMIHHSIIGITRPAVDRTLVLEYEDTLMVKGSKMSQSQCLRLGRKESEKDRLLPDGRVPQIRPTGGLEGLRGMSTDCPLILLSGT